MNKRIKKKRMHIVELENKLTIANKRADEIYDHQCFVTANNRLLRNEKTRLQTNLLDKLREKSELEARVKQLEDHINVVEAGLEESNKSILNKIRSKIRLK